MRHSILPTLSRALFTLWINIRRIGKTPLLYRLLDLFRLLFRRPPPPPRNAKPSSSTPSEIACPSLLPALRSSLLPKIMKYGDNKTSDIPITSLRITSTVETSPVSHENSLASDSQVVEFGIAASRASPEGAGEVVRQGFLPVPGVSPRPSTLTLSGANISPIWPSTLKRYSCPRPRIMIDGLASTIPPMTMEYEQFILLRAADINASINIEELQNWHRNVHPDGFPYWHHHYPKMDIDVLVDADLLDVQIRNSAQEYMNIILRRLEEHRGASQLPKRVQLVLEEINGTWGYYFVNPEKYCIFWIDESDFASDGTWWEARGSDCLDNWNDAQQYHKFQYWQHWESFHHVQQLDDEQLEEVGRLIKDLLADVRTCRESTSPFKASELESFLSMVDSELTTRSRLKSKKPPWFVGRFMSYVHRHRFSNYHGDYGARTSRMQSVRTPAKKRSNLIKLVSPLLFFTPDVHLRLLQSIWVDETVSVHPWADFVHRINKQWQGFIGCASVLLAVNMGFLAIQSIDNDKNNPTRSPAQIASYLSTLASVNSILMGLLLMRHLRFREQENAYAAANYLRKQYHSRFGHEPLAIMFSLPYAFMKLAIVLFMITFTMVCVMGTNTVTRVVCTVFELVCMIPIVYGIMMHWGNDLPVTEGDGEGVLSLFTRLDDMFQVATTFCFTQFQRIRGYIFTNSSGDPPSPVEPV